MIKTYFLLRIHTFNETDMSYLSPAQSELINY